MFGLLFDEVDKDKNGSVTLQELKLRMQRAVSRHDIKHFVQVINHYTNPDNTSLVLHFCRAWLNREVQTNTFDIGHSIASKRENHFSHFSRAWRGLHRVTSTSDWFMTLV